MVFVLVVFVFVLVQEELIEHDEFEEYDDNVAAAAAAGADEI